ncbi:MAG TPA: HAMP domain-containing sensor histidine kinase, partial [Rhizomicrobium sp.]|nr:HAMP domain-containing sensor histidine kinase [Rhizomicrobium sp.]
ANMQKFGEREEFRADMIRGMESATRKLGGLVGRLRPEAPDREAPEIVDVAQMIAEITRQLDSTEQPVRARIATDAARVRIVPSDMHAILTHLVTNAIEASEGGDEVVIGLECDCGMAVIEVEDRGSGMSAEYIRNELFVPLHSTKAQGHGMGAFQARELARAAGGEIEVVSAVGRGTSMRIVLPIIGDFPSAEPVKQAVAS